MEKLEHIGIAVKDLTTAQPLFEKLLGQQAYKTELVASEGVKTVFFKVGDVKIELLEATSEASPLARSIQKRGEGLHHLAFQVSDMQSSILVYEQKGFVFTGEARRGADNKQICFMHPKTTNGVLVELCADISS